MVDFGEKSSENTVIFADCSPKLTTVSGLKILDFNRTPSFYLRGYGMPARKALKSVKLHINSLRSVRRCGNGWANNKVSNVCLA